MTDNQGKPDRNLFKAILTHLGLLILLELPVNYSFNRVITYYLHNPSPESCILEDRSTLNEHIDH